MSLKNHWYIACPAGDLRDQPLSRQVCGLHVVLFRGADGRAAALLDRCAHRHMALSRGRVAAGCVECPYHGWRYGPDGRCTAVPSLGCDREPPAAAVVRSFPARESDGYVWVWPGDGEAGGEPYRFAHCDEPGWTTFRMRTRFAAGVEACIENFLDCPHTVFVHKGWFRNQDTRAITAVVRREPGAAEVEFQNEPDTGSVISRLLYPKDQPLRHTDRFIVPNLSRVDYDFGPRHHFIITSQCTPLTEYETEVYTVMTFRYGPWGRFIRLFFEPMSRHIIGQDVDIIEAYSQQRERFGESRAVNVETDLLALHIASLRAQAERGEPPDPRDNSARTIRIHF
jgi:phenylpropionate dioxygenase-like ring-hydroxylating dioxygenase large terminal subunit